ncbi:MAG: carboxylesterase family protein, partial [Verrucomicrobiaceae bacterium]
MRHDGCCPARRWAASFLAGLVLCALAHAAPVKVTGGEIEGVAEDGLTVYKGIPFARPPVGDLRWRAPQPPEPWTGVRKADRFGASPMQHWLFAAAVTKTMPKVNEDCLYLNVWAPATAAKEKLPVMVWIYGGGNVWGSSSFPMYD